MKLIILITVGLIFIAVLFPPFTVHYDGGGLTKQYGFILRPPEVGYHSVDLVTLVVEILIIFGFSIGVILLLRKLH